MRRTLRRWLVLAIALAAALATTTMAASAASTGVTTRASVSSSGAESNGEPESCAISADGRYVAFESWASNLVAGDTNNKIDVFVHDRVTGSTTRVNVSSSGVQSNDYSYAPAISANGRYVAFCSEATNLVADDTNGFPDVFVRDTQTGTTTRVSVSTSSVQADGESGFYGLAISADGRYVAFCSEAANLVAGDTNDTDDVFIRDRQSATTTLVSADSSGTQGSGPSGYPAISSDGPCVAFYSEAPNLVSGDTNGFGDFFVRDTQAAATTRVSVSTLGTQGNEAPGAAPAPPAISDNGRFVAFESLASNLVAGDTNDLKDVFVRDRTNNTTTRVSVSSSSGQGNWDSGRPSMSGDGRYVAFYSDADNLVTGDTNDYPDLFVRDTQSGSATRVSVSSSGAQGDDSVRDYGTPMSSDGRHVAFISWATNMVGGDSNLVPDLFVRSLTPGPGVASLSGSDRYATAIKISQTTFAAGSCDRVVLATGANFPDALGGAGLAGAADCPVLLVSGSSASTALRTEINRLTQGKASKRIYILGSSAAVSTAFENSLKYWYGPGAITRLWGTNRYGTAEAVAKEMRKVLTAKGKPFGGKAIVATGADFPDALLAGPLAYQGHLPILLVGPVDANFKSTADTIGVKRVDIIGSTTAVPLATETTLIAKFGAANVKRPCAKTDRYEQAVEVAAKASQITSGFGWNGVGITRGEPDKFADALGACSLQGRSSSFLMFTPLASLDSRIRAALVAHKAEIHKYTYFGNTNAVSDAVRNSVAEAVE